MKIVYSHNRNYIIPPLPKTEYGSEATEIDPRGGSTVAMESIQSWLLDTIEVGSTIERKVGIARCSEDDNYCKKTGRELAHSRLKTTLLKVVNKVTIGPNVTVFFEDKNKNLFEVKKSKDPYCAILVRMLEE